MPGTPKPINSPFGNSPNSLPNPVPAEGEVEDAASLLQQMPKPDAMAQPQGGAMGAGGNEGPQAGPEVAALLAQMPQVQPQPNDQFESDNGPDFSAGSGSLMLGAGIGQLQNLPDALKANIQQFRDIGTRIQAGLAANDNEVMGLLKNKYGEENIRWKDGKAWFRDKAGDKFRPLDPASFEIFSDLIPDFARGIVQEGVAAPAEIAGGYVAGPKGAQVGRIASVPLQVAAADYVAEKAGVPQDPSRSKGMEMAVQTAMEAALPIIGRQLTKRVPGTASYNAAKQAGERELTALSRQSQNVAQSVQELAALDKAVTIDGQLVGVPGAKLNLGAHQLNPESPMIKQLHEKATEFVPFNNAMRQHAEDWGDLFEKTMNEIATQGSKNNRVNPADLSKNVVDAVANVRKIEGDNIAKYKVQALRKLGDGPQQMSDAAIQPLSEIMNAIGVVPDGKGIKPDQVKKMIGQYGVTSAGEARAIANNLNDIMAALNKNKGGLTVRELDRFRNTVGDLSDRMRGTAAGRQLGQLASGLRENYKQVIESGIDNEFEKVGFRSAMDDYSQIMNNIDVLRRGLNEDSSARAIVSNFFSGKENIEKMKAIQSLSPESFDSLRAEWLNQQMAKFKSRSAPTGVEAGRFLDSLEKQYGPEFMNMVLPKQEQKTITNFLTVMDRINNTFKEGEIDQASDKLKQGMMNTLIGLVGDIKFKTVNGIAGLFKGRSGAEHAAVQLLSRDGIDKYVAAYPGKNVDKAELSQKLKNFVAEYRLQRIINAVPQVIDSHAAKTAARIGVKQRIGTKNSQMFSPANPGDM